jgi:hypothetical protein
MVSRLALGAGSDHRLYVIENQMSHCRIVALCTNSKKKGAHTEEEGWWV